MKSFSRGFSVTEVLIVVVAVGLLVLGGLWIMDKKTDTSSNSQQTTMTEEPELPVDTEQPAEQPEGIDTSGWTVFDNEVYSIRIPDGWSVETFGAGLLAFDFPTYQPGVPGETATPIGLVSSRFEVHMTTYPDEIECNEGTTLEKDSLQLGGYDAIICNGTREIRRATVTTYPVRTYEIANPAGESVQADFATHSEDGTTSLLTPERIEVIEAMLNTIQFK